MPTRPAPLAAVLAALVAAAAATAPSEAAMARETVLFDFDSGFDPASAAATDCAASLVKAGDGLALALATGHSGPWPGVTLKAPAGHWDLAAHTGVALEVRNTGAGRVTVSCRVDNAGADGASHCNTDSLALAPGASGTLTVHFKRRTPGLEGVKLFGMRGYPAGVLETARGTIDPARVIGLVIFVGRPQEDHAFTVDRIRAVGAYAAPPAPPPAARFFPFIDTFGQYMHRDWPGKTRSLDDLARAREAEEKDLAARSGPAAWNRFGGWKDGPRLRATGFFYPAKHDGRWWLVDPEGCLFFSQGIDCVHFASDTPLDDREAWWQDFPGARPEFAGFLGRCGHVVRDYYQGRQPRTFDFGGANLRRKYGEGWRAAAADLAHRRLRSWGLNTIGNWSASDVYLRKRTPYVATVWFSSPPIEGSQGYWGKFKDPFHPDFARSLAQRMAATAEKTAGDPLCLGYFVDNEIAWGDETSLAAAALESPAEQPAKQAFLEDLRAKYGAVEKLNAAWGTAHASWDALAQDRRPPDRKRAAADLGAFYDRLADRYFRTCREAVKAAAPNQMYLGCRFAWVNDRAARAAARHCDVMSYNLYRRSVAEWRLPAGLDKPVVIGEFHFGALDRGMFHTGLVPVADQDARAEAYKAYVRGAVANPQIVGCHWFQYRDQTTTGRPLDGENYQIGFVDICDTPYPETIAACREVARDLYAPAAP